MSAAQQKKVESQVEDTMNNVSKSVENATKGVDQQLGGVTKIIEDLVRKLPKGFTDWLSKNLYWLALVGGILSAIGALSSLFGLADVLAGRGQIRVLYEALKGFAPPFWHVQLSSVISTIQLTISAGLLIASFMPLKSMKTVGWKFLYWNALVVFVLNALYNVITINIIALVFQVLFALIGLWILFSVKPEFKK
jgi:hypothetical protein